MPISKIKPASLNIAVSSDPSGNIAGRMFYNTTNNQLIIQDGTNNEKQNFGALGSSIDPATSAKQLYDAGITTDGAYYIKNHWTGNVAREVYCEFDFDFKGAGTSYHLQKFDPSHMANDRGSYGPASSSLTAVSSSDLSDSTSYTWTYSSASSATGAQHVHRVGKTFAQLGQFFLRVDMDRTGTGDGANSGGEVGVMADTNNTGLASSQSGQSYAHHHNSIPNNFQFMSVGFLFPSDTGTATFGIDDITATHSNSQTTSIAEARSRLGSSSNITNITPSGYNANACPTTAYLIIGHSGWSDTSTANSSQHMYWVAAAV